MARRHRVHGFARCAPAAGGTEYEYRDSGQAGQRPVGLSRRRTEAESKFLFDQYDGYLERGFVLSRTANDGEARLSLRNSLPDVIHLCEEHRHGVVDRLHDFNIRLFRFDGCRYAPASHPEPWPLGL